MFEQEDEIQVDVRRQRDRDRMVPVREAESEHERIFLNRSRNDAVRQLCRLFHSHNSGTDDYLDIGKMDIK